MRNLKSPQFWDAAIARAIRTFCQVFIGTTAGAVIIQDINWQYVLSACVLSTLLSVANSIITGLPEVKGEE